MHTVLATKTISEESQTEMSAVLLQLTMAIDTSISGLRLKYRNAVVAQGLSRCTTVASVQSRDAFTVKNKGVYYG